MSSIRKLSILGLALAALFAGAGTDPGSAVAAAIIAIPKPVEVQVPQSMDAGIVLAAHHRHKFKYGSHHGKFHQRYHPKQRHYGQAHRRYHKHHGRRHDGPNVYLGWGYPLFYDPFYYEPYRYDPYYYDIAGVSCADARRLLRQHGYRNVRAYDCSGSTYGLYGTKGGNRYRISVSARDGRILNRRVY